MSRLKNRAPENMDFGQTFFCVQWAAGDMKKAENRVRATWEVFKTCPFCSMHAAAPATATCVVHGRPSGPHTRKETEPAYNARAGVIILLLAPVVALFKNIVI